MIKYLSLPLSKIQRVPSQKHWTKNIFHRELESRIIQIILNYFVELWITSWNFTFCFLLFLTEWWLVFYVYIQTPYLTPISYLDFIPNKYSLNFKWTVVYITSGGINSLLSRDYIKLKYMWIYIYTKIQFKVLRRCKFSRKHVLMWLIYWRHITQSKFYSHLQILRIPVVLQSLQSHDVFGSESIFDSCNNVSNFRTKYQVRCLVSKFVREKQFRRDNLYWIFKSRCNLFIHLSMSLVTIISI